MFWNNYIKKREVEHIIRKRIQKLIQQRLSIEDIEEIGGAYLEIMETDDVKYLKTKLIGGQDALIDLLDDFK